MSLDDTMKLNLVYHGDKSNIYIIFTSQRND